MDGYKAYLPPWLLALTTPGFLGVDVFFILSGFILVLVHPEVPQPGRFWLKRLLRVYPLNITVMLLMALNAWRLGKLGHGFYAWHGFLPMLLMVESFLPGRPIIGWLLTNWSVGVELICYLAFPALAFVLRRLPTTCVTMAALALLVLEAEIQRHYLGAFLHDGAILRGACGFLTGGALAALHQRTPVLAARSTATIIQLGTTLTGTILLFAGLLWPIPSLAAALIASLASRNGPAARLFSTRPAVWIGEISYSVYLLHGVILGDYAGLWLKYVRGLQLPAPIAIPLWIGALLAAILGASALTWRFVEQPGRALIRLLPPEPAGYAAAPAGLIAR